jgi:hypothetical protein
MAGVASRLTLALEIPFVMCDFNVRDVGWIKADVRLTAIPPEVTRALVRRRSSCSR